MLRLGLGLGLRLRGVRRSRVVRECVLAARERLPLGPRPRLGERRGLAALERGLHEQPPHLGREASAGHGDPVHAVERDLGPRVAHPDGRRELGRVAGEPGVDVELGGPGLAGRRPAEGGARARAGLDVLLEDARDDRGGALRDRAPALRLRPSRPRVSTVPSSSTTRRIAIGSAYTPPAASVAYDDAMSSGDTAIEPRPIDGTYAPLTSSCERTPIRRATSATFSGVDVERQLRVDGVVRAERRAADRAPAVVVVRVRLDAPPRAVVAVPGRVEPVRERRRDVVRRVGIDRPARPPPRARRS